MKIRELWRFPVKSVGGEQVDSVELTKVGIEGDRVCGIQDLATGMVLTARRSPELLFATARYHGPSQVSIMLPDGSETADDADLSAWLGKDVRLLWPSESGGTYECPIDPGVEEQWVQWDGPAGSFHDSARAMISLVSEGSLGDWDLARFRTNVLMSGSGEDEWVGRSATVGDSVRVDVIKQIDRCVMITRPQPGLDRNLELLKFINAERGTFLSVGATVASEGPISVGDSVSLV